MKKIESNVDYHEIMAKELRQYVNLARYDSNSDNWLNLEKIFIEEDFDFIDMIYYKLVGKSPAPGDKNLLLKTLGVLSLGTGCHPPSVMIPKLIASTTKDKYFAVVNGLIGGISSFGTDHLGAVSWVMEDLERIKIQSEGRDLEGVVRESVDSSLEKGLSVRGFGHPVYERDPRVKILIEEVEKVHPDNIYLSIHETLSNYLFKRKRISPNIDSALGVSYRSMGFEPEHGIYLSVLSRSLAMVCHILEEFPNKPFSFLNSFVSIEDFSRREYFED